MEADTAWGEEVGWATDILVICNINIVNTR